MDLPEIMESYAELLVLLCRPLGLEAGVRQLFDWMAGRMPCTRIVCSTVNRVTRRYTPLVEWAKDPALLIGAREVRRTMPLELLDASMGIREKDGVGILADVRDNPRALAYWAQLGTPQRASMSVNLHASEERTVSLFMDAPEPGVFTGRHAELLRLVRQPLAALLDQLCLTSPDALLTLAPEQSAAATAYDMLKRCPGLSGLVNEAELLASTEATVLVLGETGVGKDLFAETLHLLSPRRDGPFVRLNCAAVPENLIDSMFFGHERGAFTGAVQAHPGVFEQAHGGTLLLDEVGELSPLSQARLLRVLETSEFQRVGGVRRIRSDFRLVAATHRNLRAMVEAGTFREDLFYRLHVYPLSVPPLRRRREDIAPLIQYFCTRFAAGQGQADALRLSRRDVAELCLYAWPGNVRQLRNAVERLLLRALVRRAARPDVAGLLEELKREEGGRDMPDSSGHNTMGGPDTLDDVMRRHIQAVLVRCGGRIQGEGGAAAVLGLPPATLRSRMHKLGIPLPRQVRRAARQKKREIMAENSPPGTGRAV